MREIERPTIQLPTLRGSGKGATQATTLLRTWKNDPSAELKFPDHWNESDVRGALHAMQGFACVYCQGALDARDRATVDHLRPKKGGPPGGYFWLAYEFSNLFLACAWCNSRKGDRFPVEHGAAHITYGGRAQLDTEARLFVDPTCDPVSQWFDIHWQDGEKLGVVEARSSLARECIERRRAETCIEVFHLNVDVDLLQDRIQALLAMRDGIESRSREALRKQACRYLPQGAFTHAVLRASRPELLPTPGEEVLVLLEELLGKLKIAHQIQKRNPEEKDAVRRLDQLLWAFAVIWACPPREALSSAEVEAWLAKQPILQRLVEPLYRHLVPT